MREILKKSAKKEPEHDFGESLQIVDYRVKHVKKIMENK